MPRGLDTYYGRKLEKIDKDSDGHWFLELTGNVRVINIDGKNPKPTIPDGKSLVFATMVLDQKSTQLVFYNVIKTPNGERIDQNDEWRVSLSPLSYQLFDSDQAEVAWAPQAGGYGRGIEIPAPQEPTDRIASGPEEKTEEDTKPETEKPKAAKKDSKKKK